VTARAGIIAKSGGWATILPASAVQRSIDGRLLAAHSIIQPTIMCNLRAVQLPPPGEALGAQVRGDGSRALAGIGRALIARRTAIGKSDNGIVNRLLTSGRG